MWSRRNRRDHGPVVRRWASVEADAELIGEARAVLEGRVVDQLWAHSQPIPMWAWLNALARRPVGEVGDLVGLACDLACDGWSVALVDIAFDLAQVTGAEAAQIQAELFVSAELDALGEPSTLEGPDQLVRAVRRRLVSGSLRPVPKPRQSPERPES